MTIREMYEHFDRIGSCVFAAVNGNACGDCWVQCPVHAVRHKGLPEVFGERA